MEPRRKAKEIGRLRRRGCLRNVVGVNCEGEGRSRVGGLAVLWEDSLKVEIITMSLNHIDMVILKEGDEKPWRSTGTSTKSWNRRRSWAGYWLHTLKLEDSESQFNKMSYCTWALWDTTSHGQTIKAGMQIYMKDTNGTRNERRKRSHKFIFEEAWLSNEDCKEVVKRSWLLEIQGIKEKMNNCCRVLQE
ncbi:hypothetical protein PIB30_086303 [Stylosanthes scabra]|uniref:Uncharacterized protein n=1 Tax=Stylosanthes scabra TaxID=79078 RepID=A0ABU6ZRU9_9FABA|nr:hypothetical protein [Stylosanthes scabra]